MAMQLTTPVLSRLLPYLYLMDRYPKMGVPRIIREDLRLLLSDMDGLPGDTVVSEWVERQIRRL